MGKFTRKKQGAVIDKSAVPAIPVSVAGLTQFLSDRCKELGVTESDYCIQLIESLVKSQKLTEQVAITRNGKAKFITAYSDSSEQLYYIEYLIALYLLPKYEALRGSLEWLSDALSNMKERGLVRTIVRDASVRIVLTRIATLSDPTTLTLDDMIDWVAALNTMNSLDKDLRIFDNGVSSDLDGRKFLSNHTPIDTSSSTSSFSGVNPLLLLISFAAVIFSKCANMIQSKNSADVSDDLSATQLQRYGDCSGECARFIMTALKLRRMYAIPTDNSNNDNAVEQSILRQTWPQVSRTIIQAACVLLQSPLVNKDVHTSCAMTIMTIQHLQRFNKLHNFLSQPAVETIDTASVDECATAILAFELITLITLLKLAPTPPVPNDMAMLIDSTLRHSIPMMQIVPRCALLRGAFTIFSDAVLAFPVKNTTYAAWVGKFRRMYEEALLVFAHCHFDDDVAFTTTANSSSLLAFTATKTTSATTSIMFGAIAQSVLAACSANLPTIRVYALQMLEAWLARLLSTTSSGNNDNEHTAFVDIGAGADVGTGDHLQDVLKRVAKILVGSWTHPVRQLNHIVPPIYEKLLSVVAKLSRNNNTGVATGNGTSNVWSYYISLALTMPINHRGRYQNLRVLLTIISAKELLLMQPNLLSHLIYTAALNRDIASSVTSLLQQLLQNCNDSSISLLSIKDCIVNTDAMKTTEDVSDMNSSNNHLRGQYTSDLVSIAISIDRRIRTQAVDYVLPGLITFDPALAPILISLLKEKLYHSKISAVEHNQTYNNTTILWGLMNTCLLARTNDVSGSEIVEDSTDARNYNSNRVTKAEVLSAATSNDIELRLVTLFMLIYSNKTLNPIPPLELEVFKSTLKLTLKSSESDHRNKLKRVVKTFASRLLDQWRSKEKMILTSSTRALALQQLQMQQQQQQQDLLSAVDPSVEIQELEATIASSTEIIHACVNNIQWLLRTILDNVYPGCSSDREILSIELLLLLIELFNSYNAPGNIKSIKQTTLHIDIPRTTDLSHYFDASVVYTAVNLLMSSWDRSRKFASTLLLKLNEQTQAMSNKPTLSNTKLANNSEVPISNTASRQLIDHLFKFGLILTTSARLRESDAGAQILSVVFINHCLEQSCTLAYSIISSVREVELAASTNASSAGGVDYSVESMLLLKINTYHSEKAYGACKFIHALNMELAMRLRGIQSIFNTTDFNASAYTANSAISNHSHASDDNKATDTTEQVQLCHGLLSALRLCLTIAKKKGSFSRSNVSSERAYIWQSIIAYLKTLTVQAFELALIVVAAVASDVPFAPSNLGNRGIASVVGSSNTNNDGNVTTTEDFVMTSSYVNANSLMTTAAEDGEDLDASNSQKAVVTAWLLVKESSALLATLVEISPPVADNDHVMSSAAVVTKATSSRVHDTDIALLSARDIESIGVLLLESLSRLKHMGAIAETQSALETVSTVLLRHGDKSVHLSSIPSKWLQQLLDKFYSSDKINILRRSAGFAYSFLSVLKGESKHCTLQLLPHAMTELLSIVSRELLADLSKTPIAEVIPVAKRMKFEGSANMRGLVEHDWRLSVHALNVVRLIIIDNSFHDNLDRFIVPLIELILLGFRSTRWAIRNSCMLAFTAIIQRTFVNNTICSGGQSNVTAEDYFERFHGLFDFIVLELCRILGCTIHASTEKTTIQFHSQVSGSSSVDDQPSLFPLLVLLSKMGTPMHGYNKPFDLLSIKSKLTVDTVIVSTTAVHEQQSVYHDDISFVIVLLEFVLSSSNLQVRIMAAQAIASLVPIPLIASYITTTLVDVLKPSSQLSLNTTAQLQSLHGSLLVVEYVLKQFCASSGTFVSTAKEELHDDVITEHASLMQDNYAYFAEEWKRIVHKMLGLWCLTIQKLTSVSCSVLQHTMLNTTTILTALCSTYFDGSVELVGTATTQQLLSKHYGTNKVVAILEAMQCEHWSILVDRNLSVTVVGLNSADVPVSPELLRIVLSDLTLHACRNELAATDAFTGAASVGKPDSGLGRTQFRYSLQYLLDLLLNQSGSSWIEVDRGIVDGLTSFLNSKELRTMTSRTDNNRGYRLINKIATCFVDYIEWKVNSSVVRDVTLALTAIARMLSLDTMHEVAEDRALRLLKPFAWQRIVGTRIGTGGNASSVDCVFNNSTSFACIELLGWILASQFKLLAKQVNTAATTQIDTASSIADLDLYLTIVQQALNNVENIDCRIAAVQSLAHARLQALSDALSTATTLAVVSDESNVVVALSRLLLRYWKLCLVALQDEHEDVRGLLNAALQQQDSHALQSSPDQTARKLVPTVETLTAQIVVVNNMSNLVICAVTGCLNIKSQSHALTNSVHALLNDVVEEVEAATGNVETVQCILNASSSQLSEKIFEAELSNLYEEKIKTGELYIAVLNNVFQHLIRDANSTNTHNVLLLITPFIHRSAATLYHAITILRTIRNNTSTDNVFNERWISDLTYHKDVFQYTYLALHGMISLLRSISTTSTGSSTQDTTWTTAKMLALDAYSEWSTLENATNSGTTKFHPRITEIIAETTIMLQGLTTIA